MLHRLVIQQVDLAVVVEKVQLVVVEVAAQVQAVDQVVQHL